MRIVPKRKLVSGIGDTHPKNILQYSQHITADQITVGAIKARHISLIDLDDLGDGTTYGRILTTSISAGKIKLDEVVEGTYGRVLTTSISAGKIKLDEVVEGTYGRVLTTDISAGHIKLDEVIEGTYGRVLTTDISAGHILLSAATGTLDNIADGTNYEKAAATEISAGKVKLTTQQNMGSQGFSVVSGTGTTRIEMTATHIAGYNANVLQFELLASDGKGYFGAGKCILSSTGINLDIDGTGATYLNLGSATYGASIYRETGAGGNLVLNPSPNYVYMTKLKFPTVAGGGELRLPVKTTTGDPTATDGYIYINDYDNALRIYADAAWRSIITW